LGESVFAVAWAIALKSKSTRKCLEEDFSQSRQGANENKSICLERGEVFSFAPLRLCERKSFSSWTGYCPEVQVTSRASIKKISRRAAEDAENREFSSRQSKFVKTCEEDKIFSIVSPNPCQ